VIETVIALKVRRGRRAGNGDAARIDAEEGELQRHSHEASPLDR